MNPLLEAVTQFRNRDSNVANRKCVDPPIGCGRDVVLALRDEPGYFRDLASIGEYKLSALCQVCQDRIFEEDK